MTISSLVRKAGPYVGAGTTATFAFAFKVFADNDVEVVEVDGDGNITTLVLTSDFTVSLNGDQDSSPGGTITLMAGNLPVGTSLIISSTVAQLQSTDIQNGGGFFPDVINAALDKLTILVQQLQAQLNLCIQFPITDTVDGELPSVALRRGHLLGFDSGTGAPVAMTATIGTIGTGTNLVSFSATPVFDLSLGTQQSITLTGDVTSSTTVTSSGAPTVIVMRIKQDATGGHAFVWPTNFDNAGLVNPTANSTSTQAFAIDISGRATAIGPIMYS